MKALITGITGQDGSYLTELLLSKGYEVHGTKRRSSSFNTSRIDHLIDNPAFHMHYADVCDQASIQRVMTLVGPDEIYNLAAQSHVGVSFEIPSYTADAAGMGALNVIEAMRHCAPRARLYQASSSEMFGNSPAPQNEETRFAPRSPYACAKVFAHHTAVSYREAYGLNISCGILFNHESPRRGETFVTRKIARGLARIAVGLEGELVLGNLGTLRDWGYAPEYVGAMWRMLQQPQPDDYVIGTGITACVGDFLDICLSISGVPQSRVKIDARYRRPAEVNRLCADAAKAENKLAWRASTYWQRVAGIMMAAEMEAANREAKFITCAA